MADYAHFSDLPHSQGCVLYTLLFHSPGCHVDALGILLCPKQTKEVLVHG